jgi:steroid 5-alpha reductase family enzyme
VFYFIYFSSQKILREIEKSYKCLSLTLVLLYTHAHTHTHTHTHAYMHTANAHTHTHTHTHCQVIGFIFETVADFSKSAFNDNPENKVDSQFFPLINRCFN